MRRHLGAPPDQESTVAAKAERQRTLYQTLLQAARLTVRQAERVRDLLSGQTLLAHPSHPEEQRQRRILTQLTHVIPLTQQVISQARQRVIQGQQVPAREKMVSLFEPHTRIIPRHKGGAALEFGRQMMLDAVDGGILIRASILADDESEHHQAIPATQHHQQVFGRVPRLVVGDRGLHAAGVEAQLRAVGVHQVAIAWTGRVGAARRAREHERSWRRRYRWRAGIEGRIHVLRRAYGLRRARSHGMSGLARDVGWGGVAYNLHQIAVHLARPHPTK